jgi:hypothetical protein
MEQHIIDGSLQKTLPLITSTVNGALRDVTHRLRKTFFPYKMPYCFKVRVCDFIYAFHKSTAFAVPIFAEVTQSRHYVGISYSEFHPNGKMNVESWISC